MNLQEALLSALADLASHKLRSGLAMLGVVFGVGAVIAMLSIGAGAEIEAMAMIERLGVNNILVRDRDFDTDRLREIRETSRGLSMRDAEAIRQAVPEVDLIAPKVTIDTYSVRSDGYKTEAEVVGVSDRHQGLAGLRLTEGRFLDARDLAEHAQVCVIGPAVGRALFLPGQLIGERIEVNDLWLTVVGVLEGSAATSDSFQGVSLDSNDNTIFLPVSTALRKFDRDPLDSPLSELVVRVREDLPSEVASRSASRSIRRLVEHLHGGEDDFEVIVPQALLEQSRQTQRLFNLVMGSIAGISLLVGGIGIMNIMLASVMERTREIGVRRAVGAKRRDIQLQFVVESFSISLLGGFAGVLMGIGIARAIAAAAGWPTSVSLVSILLSTIVSMTVGVASGLYPAIRAANLDPIESLRYE